MRDEIQKLQEVLADLKNGTDHHEQVTQAVREEQLTQTETHLDTGHDLILRCKLSCNDPGHSARRSLKTCTWNSQTRWNESVMTHLPVKLPPHETLWTSLRQLSDAQQATHWNGMPQSMSPETVLPTPGRNLENSNEDISLPRHITPQRRVPTRELQPQFWKSWDTV